LTHSHAEETYMTNQTGDETARLEHTPQHDAYHDDFLDENPDISGSTPRAPPTRSDLAQQQRFADYGDSPYADLTQKMKGAAITSDPEDDDDIDLTLPPVTPGTEQRLPRMAMGTPLSSPFKPSAASTKKPDTLLHRVMDKNYRLQATPLAGASSRKPMAAHHSNKTPLSKPSWRDMDSPGSSSPIEAPRLRTQIFSSPVRDTRRRPAPVAPTPRTPGISVQTPAKKTPSRGYVKDEITWESSGDEGDDVYQRLGMSPPKPIHFDIPPGRLLQTPAQEAGRRIVEDLLETAGAGKSLDWGEDSPSMVRPSGGIDDSF
jgi:DASH complex subunit ASK1